MISTNVIWRLVITSAEMHMDAATHRDRSSVLAMLGKHFYSICGWGVLMKFNKEVLIPVKYQSHDGLKLR